jgi:hypothetical protein
MNNLQFSDEQLALLGEHLQGNETEASEQLVQHVIEVVVFKQCKANATITEFDFTLE